MATEKIEVTKDEFYSTVGPMNVHPTILGGWDEEKGYLHCWKHCVSGEVIGYSQDGRPHLKVPARYWVLRAI